MSNGVTTGNGDVIVESRCFGVTIQRNAYAIWPPIETLPPTSTGYTYLRRTSLLLLIVFALCCVFCISSRSLCETEADLFFLSLQNLPLPM